MFKTLTKKALNEVALSFDYAKLGASDKTYLHQSNYSSIVVGVTDGEQMFTPFVKCKEYFVDYVAGKYGLRDHIEEIYGYRIPAVKNYTAKQRYICFGIPVSMNVDMIYADLLRGFNALNDVLAQTGIKQRLFTVSSVINKPFKVNRYMAGAIQNSGTFLPVLMSYDERLELHPVILPAIISWSRIGDMLKYIRLDKFSDKVLSEGHHVGFWQIGTSSLYGEGVFPPVLRSMKHLPKLLQHALSSKNHEQLKQTSKYMVEKFKNVIHSAIGPSIPKAYSTTADEVKAAWQW